MNDYKENYYRGRGLIFDHKAQTVTNLDNGTVKPLKNIFTDAMMAKQTYFAEWVRMHLFPTKH